MIRSAHLVIGILGLVLFVLSGQYMARVIGVPELADTQRLLWRSSHIYFLLPCVTNVIAGCYLAPGAALGKLRTLASALLLLSPFVLGYSFMVEPGTVALEREWVLPGLFAAFLAASLAALAEGLRWWQHRGDV
jgi:hypothetical protein